MTKYSLKITGPYNEVGSAMATFFGENEVARKALFGDLRPRVSESQMGDDPSVPENLIGVVNYELDGPLLIDNLVAFETMFPNTDLATLVVQ